MEEKNNTYPHPSKYLTQMSPGGILACAAFPFKIKPSLLSWLSSVLAHSFLKELESKNVPFSSGWPTAPVQRRSSSLPIDIAELHRRSPYLLPSHSHSTCKHGAISLIGW